MTQLDLSAKIIGDINLCGGATPPVQGTPSISQLGVSSFSKPTGEACGLNQPGIGGAIFFSSINARVPETRARCQAQRAASAVCPDQPIV